MKPRTNCKTRCHSYCLTVSVTVKAASYSKLLSHDITYLYTIGAHTVILIDIIIITNQPN